MIQNKSHVVLLCVGCISLVFITSGIFLSSSWPAFYDYIFTRNLVLRPNSALYNAWVKVPIPLTFNLYMFNWTNPGDVRNSGVKPKFEQLGPYTYRQTKENADITWNTNGTVTFRHLKKWFFDEESSNGSLSDSVTSINPVALASASVVRNWNYFVRRGLSGTLQMMKVPIATTRSVREILFDGYEDDLLDVLKKIAFLVNPEAPSVDKFGWFYGRNGSADVEGVFNMDTGISGQLGKLYAWKYADRTPYYEGKCGKAAEVSEGDFYPTNLTKETIIKFFSADLCRYVELEFEKETTIHGITGYKYSAADRFLDNGTKVPENKCFCDGKCMPSGALDVSKCRYGTPAFVSLPHFFKADPYYTQIVEGLKPEEETGEFYMIFEPTTGTPLQVAARLQLNLLLQPISGITLYERVPTAYFPVLWFEQVVTLPESMAFGVKLLINFKTVCWVISAILISIGVLIDLYVCHKICAMHPFSGRMVKTLASEEVPLKLG